MNATTDSTYLKKMGKWVSKRFSSLGSKAGENDSGGEYVSRSAQSKGDHVSKPKVERKSASEDKSSAPKPAANLGKVMEQTEFFTEYGEMNRYVIHEVVGKGSYGVVCSATDKKTGEKVAIKKITDVFEHVSDATRILREIKLLRKLKHPDIVEIKHIMLPPSEREFRDIFVVFELMESDLHQVIKANDDLTTEHYKYFMYQLLSGLMHVHSANVFHRDLKPKNILANADCKLKICDFGLARPAFNDQPSTVFWTDYVATRWYRAPELCGSFFSKYTPAVDVWGLGCILAEVILGKPLFPGRNVVHQLELITDLLGTPTPEHLAKVRNDKARRFLANMKLKPAVPFSSIFDGIDLGIVNLLEKMLKFDPADRPSATQCLQDVLFNGLRTPAHEARAQPISKLSFEFERRKLSKDDVRHLIYQEILEYHPQFKSKMVDGDRGTGHFVYPSAVDRFKREFAAAEAQIPGGDAAMQKDSGMDMRSSCSMPRERVLLNEGVQQAQATDMARSSSIGQRALEDEIMEENEQGSLQMN